MNSSILTVNITFSVCLIFLIAESTGDFSYNVRKIKAVPHRSFYTSAYWI